MEGKECETIMGIKGKCPECEKNKINPRVCPRINYSEGTAYCPDCKHSWRIMKSPTDIHSRVAEIIEHWFPEYKKEDSDVGIAINKILQLMVLEGVEKYRECPECQGRGKWEERLTAISSGNKTVYCDKCDSTGEIVKPIRFDEVEWSINPEYCYESKSWNLKPHLSMWKVRGKK